MLIEKYSLDRILKELPEDTCRESFFIGIAAYQNLIARAQEEEIPEHQVTIVELLHFEVSTELGNIINKH